VRDARTRRQGGYTGDSGHLRPALGRKRRGLLVPRVHQADAFAAATVVEREQVTAGEGEYGVDAAGFQAPRDQTAGMDCRRSVDAHGGEPKRWERAERRPLRWLRQSSSGG